MAVLTWLYPAEATNLESLVQPAQPAGAPRFSGGVAIGRAIGAQVIASAANDNFNPVWTGTVPVGPRFWFSAAPPIAPRLGEMRPFFLTSGSQFRPGPPPVFGSQAFLQALAEIRHLSDTRTAEQDALAKFWAVPHGALVIPAYENSILAGLIREHGLSERGAAHAFALVNQAAMDGFIACHDAKYTYWFLRPNMADPLITTSVPVPNHPSYPSNHACVTGAFMAVSGAIFTTEAARLKELADEAARSRVVGGIHYRFDGEVGLTLGRTIAAWAVAHDVATGTPFPIK
ncbi:MAG: vanadium-dependent haloperoxidase [Gemmatimonadota bacterium]